MEVSNSVELHVESFVDNVVSALNVWRNRRVFASWPVSLTACHGSVAPQYPTLSPRNDVYIALITINTMLVGLCFLLPR